MALSLNTQQISKAGIQLLSNGYTTCDSRINYSPSKAPIAKGTMSCYPPITVPHRDPHLAAKHVASRQHDGGPQAVYTFQVQALLAALLLDYCSWLCTCPSHSLNLHTHSTNYHALHFLGCYHGDVFFALFV